jgi:cytoskeletal protein RodZ
MNQVERDLHESLRPRQAPPDFAEKVLARARQSERRWVPRTWVAVAALVILMIGSLSFIQQQRRRAEGETAKEQLMAALRITGSKFRDVKDRLSGIRQRPGHRQSQN